MSGHRDGLARSVQVLTPATDTMSYSGREVLLKCKS